MTLTSNDGKEKEHDRIEEAKTNGQGVLVDHSRDDKDGQHGSCSEFPVGQLQGSEEEQRGGVGLNQNSGVSGGICATGLKDCHWGHTWRIQMETIGMMIIGLCGPNAHQKKVSVAVVEQPVMDNHVPGAVIVGERCWVPPVLGNRV